MRIVEQSRDRLRIVDRKMLPGVSFGLSTGLMITIPLVSAVVKAPPAG